MDDFETHLASSVLDWKTYIEAINQNVPNIAPPAITAYSLLAMTKLTQNQKRTLDLRGGEFEQAFVNMTTIENADRFASICAKAIQLHRVLGIEETKLAGLFSYIFGIITKKTTPEISFAIRRAAAIQSDWPLLFKENEFDQIKLMGLLRESEGLSNIASWASKNLKKDDDTKLAVERIIEGWNPQSPSIEKVAEMFGLEDYVSEVTTTTTELPRPIHKKILDGKELTLEQMFVVTREGDLSDEEKNRVLGEFLEEFVSTTPDLIKIFDLFKRALERRNTDIIDWILSLTYNGNSIFGPYCKMFYKFVYHPKYSNTFSDAMRTHTLSRHLLELESEGVFVFAPPSDPPRLPRFDVVVNAFKEKQDILSVIPIASTWAQNFDTIVYPKHMIEIANKWWPGNRSQLPIQMFAQILNMVTGGKMAAIDFIINCTATAYENGPVGEHFFWNNVSKEFLRKYATIMIKRYYFYSFAKRFEGRHAAFFINIIEAVNADSSIKESEIILWYRYLVVFSEGFDSDIGKKAHYDHIVFEKFKIVNKLRGSFSRSYNSTVTVPSRLDEIKPFELRYRMPERSWNIDLFGRPQKELRDIYKRIYRTWDENAYLFFRRLIDIFPLFDPARQERKFEILQNCKDADDVERILSNNQIELVFKDPDYMTQRGLETLVMGWNKDPQRTRELIIAICKSRILGGSQMNFEAVLLEKCDPPLEITRGPEEMRLKMALRTASYSKRWNSAPYYDAERENEYTQRFVDGSLFVENASSYRLSFDMYYRLANDVQIFPLDRHIASSPDFWRCLAFDTEVVPEAKELFKSAYPRLFADLTKWIGKETSLKVILNDKVLHLVGLYQSPDETPIINISTIWDKLKEYDEMGFATGVIQERLHQYLHGNDALDKDGNILPPFLSAIEEIAYLPDKQELSDERDKAEIMAEETGRFVEIDGLKIDLESTEDDIELPEEYREEAYLLNSKDLLDAFMDATGIKSRQEAQKTLDKRIKEELSKRKEETRFKELEKLEKKQERLRKIKLILNSSNLAIERVAELKDVFTKSRKDPLIRAEFTVDQEKIYKKYLAKISKFKTSFEWKIDLEKSPYPDILYSGMKQGIWTTSKLTTTLMRWMRSPSLTTFETEDELFEFSGARLSYGPELAVMCLRKLLPRASELSRTKTINGIFRLLFGRSPERKKSETIVFEPMNLWIVDAIISDFEITQYASNIIHDTFIENLSYLEITAETVDKDDSFALAVQGIINIYMMVESEFPFEEFVRLRAKSPNFTSATPIAQITFIKNWFHSTEGQKTHLFCVDDMGWPKFLSLQKEYGWNFWNLTPQDVSTVLTKWFANIKSFDTNIHQVPWGYDPKFRWDVLKKLVENEVPEIAARVLLNSDISIDEEGQLLELVEKDSIVVTKAAFNSEDPQTFLFPRWISNFENVLFRNLKTPDLTTLAMIMNPQKKGLPTDRSEIKRILMDTKYLAMSPLAIAMFAFAYWDGESPARGVLTTTLSILPTLVDPMEHFSTKSSIFALIPNQQKRFQTGHTSLLDLGLFSGWDDISPARVTSEQLERVLRESIGVPSQSSPLNTLAEPLKRLIADTRFTYSAELKRTLDSLDLKEGPSDILVQFISLLTKRPKSELVLLFTYIAEHLKGREVKDEIYYGLIYGQIGILKNIKVPSTFPQLIGWRDEKKRVFDAFWFLNSLTTFNKIPQSLDNPNQWIRDIVPVIPMELVYDVFLLFASCDAWALYSMFLEEISKRNYWSEIYTTRVKRLFTLPFILALKAMSSNNKNAAIDSLRGIADAFDPFERKTWFVDVVYPMVARKLSLKTAEEKRILKSDLMNL